MSKKLIAVAAAAALAITGLVAVPANSAGPNLTILPAADSVGGAVTGNGLTSTTAFEVAVPSRDVLRSTATVSNRSALALVVNTRSDNAAITVTSTGAVELLTSAQVAASTTNTTTGTQSLTLTANSSGVANFFAYTTSTSSGSITVVESGTTPASNTVWVKGTSGAENAYTLTAVVPTVAGMGSTVEFTATVRDMFGNAIENAHTITPQVLGGNSSITGNMVWNATTKVYEDSFIARTTAGTTALSIPLTVFADSVTALGARNVTSFTVVSIENLQASITALQAQIAALNAQLAATVTKAKYNKLVRKWNRANPNNKVKRVS
jgi:uncharacterized small protein (DUF1192 family)